MLISRTTDIRTEPQHQTENDCVNTGLVTDLRAVNTVFITLVLCSLFYTYRTNRRLVKIIKSK